nr:glycoside hydrolase family 55 protein [Sphingomonas sp. KC8]
MLGKISDRTIIGLPVNSPPTGRLQSRRSLKGVRMTVNSGPSSQAFSCDGATTAWSLADIQFLQPLDLLVTLVAADGARTELTEGVGYTLAGDGMANSATLTRAPADAIGNKIEVLRSTARVQKADYVSNDPFPAEAHERELDRRALIEQEQDDAHLKLDTRAVKVQDGEVAPTLAPVATRASKYAAFDVNGNWQFLDGQAPPDQILLPAGSDLVGFSHGVTYKPGTVGNRLGRMVYVTDAPYNAKGDGVANDTVAIASALFSGAAHIHFPPGTYNITSMTWILNSKLITFAVGAKIFGIATSAQNAIVRLHNFRNCRIENMALETDGAAIAPVYHQNYGCALQFTSDSGAGPTQFVTIDGLWIRYIKAGIVNGNLLGQAAQASFPQSEIFIRDYRQRGVLQPYYGNATNSYITTTGSTYVPQKFEASSSWWDDAQGFCLRNDIGEVVSIGDEFQRAVTAGFNIYGKGITIIAPIWEHTCPNYITGDVTIADIANGYFGSSSGVPFIIDPAAKGRLRLRNCNMRRPDGTASSSRSLFADCKNNDDFQVIIESTRLKEWAYQTNAGNAHLVLGGKALFRDLEIDNSQSTQPSWRLNSEPRPITAFDTTGASMATAANLTAKGGWTVTGAPAGASFNKYTADLPPGATSAIQFTTVATSMTVTTPTGTAGHPVVHAKDHIVKMQLKGIGATITNFSVAVIWYDYAGSQISVSTVFAADKARLDTNGFDTWQELRAPAAAPADAVFAAFQVVGGATSDVVITGLRLE